MIVDSPAIIEQPNKEEIAVAGLRAVKALFQSLNQSSVRYCHWKSNVRLEVTLAGRTDLDLLVDLTDKPRFRQIIQAADIKAVLAPNGSQYPNLEDYLGYDRESGEQYHLHVHYKLVLGEQFVKNYWLPVEKAFLNSVRLVQGVLLPSPEWELIILALRALLKYRDRDVIKDTLNILSPGIPEHILSEINWLLTQTNLAKVENILAQVSIALPAASIIKFLRVIEKTPRDGVALYRLRSRVYRSLRPYKRHSRIRARAIYFRELWRRRNSFLKFKPTPRMTFAPTGKTIALVGIDGAGKTTLARVVVEWLTWKLDVYPFYLGSKQPSWFSKNAYLLFRMWRRGHREISNRIGDTIWPVRAMAAIRDSVLYCHYLFTGLDRLGRFRDGRRLARRGSLVVYDRYPLQAPLDGPQIAILAGERAGWLANAFAQLEQWLYDKITLPDMLFVLELDPDVAWQRKPDHIRDEIIYKSKRLDELVSAMEGRGNRPVHIDASQPLDAVIKQLKEEIWSRLG